MARLAIDKDFLDDYSKLPKAVQTNVKTAIDKFAEHVHAGLHLEKLNHSKDDRIRIIRIDQFWRGVVLAPDSGDTYSLIRVMPHDKAIDYAASHRFICMPSGATWIGPSETAATTNSFDADPARGPFGYTPGRKNASPAGTAA